MAYSFSNNSGITDTAQQTGHLTQRIFNGPGTLFGGIGYIISIVLGFLGIIFFGLIFYGGWLWMTAQGNESQVDKAKGIIISGIVGVLIILSAYAISFLIVSSLAPTNIIQ